MGTSTIGAGTAPRQAEMARVSQQPSELLVVLDRLAWGSMIAVVGFGAYRMCVALPATAHLPQRRYTIIQANQNPVRERSLTPRSLVKRFASRASHAASHIHLSNEVIVASVVLIAGSVYFAGRWWQAADFTGILHPR